MAGTNPETLAFFAPGLLHQFGNLWLSIDGHAHLLDAESPDALRIAREAIVGTTRDGRACLEMMRYLLGEPAAKPDALADVLGRVLVVARVPLREAQHGVELRLSVEDDRPLVNPADVVVMTTEAIRRLVASLPNGSVGKVVIGGFCDASTAATVEVWYEPDPDTLPFPIAEQALGGLVELAETRQNAVDCAPRSMGIALRFPLVAATVPPGTFR